MEIQINCDISIAYHIFSSIPLFIFFFLVSPNFLEWGFWSPCTKTCGAGTRIRHRECFHGIDENPFCPEEKKTEITDCNTFQCPSMYISVSYFNKVYS